MIFTNDIYRYIGNSLELQGYQNIKDVSIEILKEEIRKYLMYKLNEKDNSLVLKNLFKRFESFIAKKDKINVMGQFIHYILWYISINQDFEIIWEIDDNQKEPTFKESKYFSGKIDSLITNKEIDYLKTFEFCIEIAQKIKEEGRGRH